MSHLLLVELCLVEDSTNFWWIDFKTTNHIYNSLEVSTKEKVK